VRKRKRVTHLNSAGYETKRKNKASTNKKGAKRAKRQDVPEPLYRDHRDQEMNTVRTGARGLLAARNEDAYNKLANLLQQMMDD
jgi:hypothetical protein